MLHPSYTDLMKTVNGDSEANNTQPVVSSRYSIVIAAAKRARQIIDGSEPFVKAKCNKPLSIAVEEISTSNVKILTDEEYEASKAEYGLDTNTEDEDLI